MNNLITSTTSNNNDGILIDSEKSKKWLLDSVSNETQSVDFCSAFITVGSLRFFYESFCHNGFSGPLRLLARWQLTDLLTGSSDLESYEFAKKNGLRFYVNQDFHGKVYSVDPAGILIGSANLTCAGFALKQNKNGEVCVTTQKSQVNNNFVDNLFVNATEIDDKKFILMKDAFELNKKIKNANPSWPDEILNFLTKEQKVDGLIVDEMFHLRYSEISHAAPATLELIHDMSLLGLTDIEKLDSELVKSRFLRSKSFLWLIQKFNNGPGYFYFGELTGMLHDDIIDDPVPYRKDIKGLLQNLLDWSEEFAKDFVTIDRPNHSQRVTKVI